ncbi:hypothetical protein FPV67DRAFT_763649 [Lyophyllum atratum]|nr:hypothetical protein FPV67DRAFT_763649 [Lyophyllum atratum]
MPTVEIARFPASDEFVTDPLILEDALETLINTEGVISPHYGLQTEDGRTGYLVVIWKTYEHHMNLMRQPSYPGLIACLTRARSGPLDLQHVDFDNDIAPALEAPATEFAFMTPKPGASIDDFKAKLKVLGDTMTKEGVCRVPLGLGESTEHKGTWVMVIGWDSVQAHKDAVSKGPYPELIKSLQELAYIDLKHANLVKYTKQ